MNKSANFQGMKRRREKITVLTACDCPTAKAESAAGIDIILVGDSVGTNVLGYDSEPDVTVSDISHHLRAVRRGAPSATIIADLPWRSYKTPDMAVANAKQLVDSGADFVKFEGSDLEIAEALVTSGIEVAAISDLNHNIMLTEK